MLKSTSQLTAFRLETVWIETASVLILFLNSTDWLLILTNAFQTGYELACSTAGSNSAEVNETGERRGDP